MAMTQPQYDGTRFEDATTPERDPATPGRYLATMSDQWNAPVLPHGGVACALALRAAEAEIDLPDQRLRTMSAVFAGQVAPGPVEIDTTVLRRGRSMSQATAHLRNVGSEAGHHVTAAFGASRVGAEFVDVTPPDVLGPGQSEPFRPPDGVDPDPENFWGRVEGRLALGNGWWEEGWKGTSSDRAQWYRYVDPPTTPTGDLDPLAVVALCDTMPGAVFQRLGHRTWNAYVPSVDLTVHLFQAAGTGWLLASNRARYSGDGYASVEMEIWDRDRGLVAYATQVMLFSFPEGVPPAEELRPST